MDLGDEDAMMAGPRAMGVVDFWDVRGTTFEPRTLLVGIRGCSQMHGFET
jgi:hypothetical protein